MALARVDRERISDSRRKIQSVAESLRKVNTGKIPHFADIQECLADAEKSLEDALQTPDRE